MQRGFMDASGMSVFECELRDDAGPLASARLNVYQPDDPNVFIQEQPPL
ncbi:hypothetical protein WJ966_12250 [Achromobacter xylosoxidans]